MKLREQRSPQQFAGGVVMSFAKLAGEGKRGLAVSRSGGAGHLQQLISHLGHRADDHDGMQRQTSSNDLADPQNSLGVTHRGAAEFHHNAASSHSLIAHSFKLLSGYE